MDETITFVGLDVHKASISVSIAKGGERGGSRFLGTIANTRAALSKLAAKLARKGGELRFCYERAVMGSGAT